MKLILFLLLCYMALANQGFSQDEEEFIAPKFEKVDLGESGATAYLPESDSLVTSVDLSEDGSKVFTAGVQAGDYYYGIILAQFAGFTLDTKEDRENTLIAYLDYLQEMNSIMYSAGYGMGHALATDESVEGVIDFWVDAEGDEWAVTGWVQPDAIAVMYILGPGTYPNYTLSKFFFNGISF
jgi:hypothetical protein